MTIKSTLEEQEYYFILGIFENDYELFRDALKELSKDKTKPKILLSIIEDIRFFPTETKQRNYDKIKPSVEKLLDLGMDTIRAYKVNKNQNLFGFSEENYTEELFKQCNTK